MRVSTSGSWPARVVRALTLGLLWQAPQLAAAQTPTATWQWATRATSTTAPNDLSRGRFIKVDGAGNTFSAGDFRGTLTLGGTSLASPGDYNSFVAKYTPSGAVAWVRHLDGSTSETVVYGLAVDNGGNSYASGYYSGGTLVIGGTTLTGGGGFLVKYDPQGTVLWARGAGEVFAGLACTAAGEVVAMGSFSGTQAFGSTTLTSAAAGSNFLVKYDARGTALWARQIEGVSNDEGFVEVDATGNIYLAADYDGLATFGSITLAGSAGGDDAFVAKYSAAGVPLWAVQQPVAGPAGREHAWDLATDAAGNSYLTGSTEPSATTERWFVTQYTPQGTVGWNYLSTAGPAGASGLVGVATDAAGNVVVSGGISGSFAIGGLSLTTASGNDLDLALFSFSRPGTPRYALSAGTTASTEAAIGLALDALSNVHVTGAIEGNTTFGTLAVPQNSASAEQFVAKVSVNIPSATARARAIEALRAYPNPTSGDAELTLRWADRNNAPSQLLVRDALGRCVLTQTIAGGRSEAVLPLRGLAPGVYTTYLEAGATRAIGRLAVE